MTGGASSQFATFEEALEGARPAVGRERLAELLEPLFADCKREDDLEARACETTRNYLVEQLRAGTYYSFGDDAALSFAPYDSAEKKLDLDVQGCLACSRPIEIDGKPRFVTTRVPKAITKGHAVGLDVGFPSVSQPDAQAAATWQKQEGARLRVEYVFRVGPVWRSGAFDGVQFQPLAWRVVNRCSGKVLASEPASQQAVAREALVLRDASCPESLSDEERKRREEAALPDQLSPKDINRTLAPVKERVHDCYAEFDISGTATVKLVVEPDGSVSDVALQPPFDKTPTGYCVRTAIKGVAFPRFRGEKMHITYPFKLQ